MSPDESGVVVATPFAARKTVEQVDKGLAFTPKFDRWGLLPCVTTDAVIGEVLILAYYMNDEVLQRTITTGHR